jgi:hypothetical protein
MATGTAKAKAHHEEVTDTEGQVVVVGGIELCAGEEIRMVGTQRRNGMDEKECRDQKDRDYDGRTGGGGGQLE